MPVYEYRCKNCGHDFEITQSMSDDTLTDCPECGEPQLRKVFQPVGIAFKGSGFYKTDSRSSTSSSKSGDTSTSGSSAGSSGTKSETASVSSDSPSSSAD